jgi:predicted SnoaL-like aldol condensation-catalyzing enzyme
MEAKILRRLSKNRPYQLKKKESTVLKVILAALATFPVLNAAAMAQHVPAAPAGNPGNAAVAASSQAEANKQLALAFYRKGITPEERLALLHPDYIQHDPMFQRFNEINDVTGRQAVGEIMKVFRAGGGPPPQPPGGDPTFLVMSEGDLVMILQKRQAPDPQNAGKFYESFWFEMWRVKDGKLYEHWDPATIPEKIPEFLQHPQPK